jgi:hypothetical protein
MIRIASQPKPVAPAWHEVFLTMAPQSETRARLSFRHLQAEARAEAVQNALCSACAAVARGQPKNYFAVSTVDHSLREWCFHLAPAMSWFTGNRSIGQSELAV